MSNASPAPFKPLALIGLACILSLVWGSAFTMTKVAVRDIDPIWLVAMRCSIGSILLVSWMFYRGRRFPKLTDKRWLWYCLLGFVGMVLPFWLFSTGQQVIDSGLAAILAGTMPLITIVLAHFFVAGEPLSTRKALGFFIGFIGIITLFLPEDFSLALVADWQSQALMIAAAFCYAATTIIAKRAPETLGLYVWNRASRSFWLVSAYGAGPWHRIDRRCDNFISASDCAKRAERGG